MPTWPPLPEWWRSWKETTGREEGNEWLRDRKEGIEGKGDGHIEWRVLESYAGAVWGGGGSIPFPFLQRLLVAQTKLKHLRGVSPFVFTLSGILGLPVRVRRGKKGGGDFEFSLLRHRGNFPTPPFQSQKPVTRAKCINSISIDVSYT